MEAIKYFVATIASITIFLSSYSQVYRTTEDTVKLNKEYTELIDEIASITNELTIAQNDLRDLQTKAKKAGASAKDAASASNFQAYKAKNGAVQEGKRAKSKVKKALRKAKESKSAEYDVVEQKGKVNTLAAQLDQKRERKQEIELMRKSIDEQMGRQILNPQ